MWLIEDPNQRFYDPQVAEEAVTALSRAHERKKLTIVVGNGVSRSSLWRSNAANPAGASGGVGWSEIILQAAESAGLEKDLCREAKNQIALAQACTAKAKNSQASRRKLLIKLNNAFKKPIIPSLLDGALVTLVQNGNQIVTTNYDFQVERSLESKKVPWRCIVRDSTVKQKARRSQQVSIHKMHGSLEIPSDLNSKSYSFPLGMDPLSSVVITESDYDKCLRGLHKGLSNSPLANALTNNLLIIGKSLDPLDASFLYALRQTRSNRQRAKSKAWFIQCGQLTADDRIQCANLGLTPVEIRMPRVVSGGHYYYAVLLALQGLFPNLLKSLAKKAMQEEFFAALVGEPAVLAIGLASINLTGCMRKGGVSVVPTAGRHNVRFENSEEHLGGAALTPLMVAAALETPSDRPRSFALCSAIGKKNEPATQRLLRDAGTLKIARQTILLDLDSTSLTEEQTWHSTVIVHRGTYSKDGATQNYDGQRIFLDRGYDKAVSLGASELVQLQEQLKAKTLKVLYFDKFLAAQHPPVSRRHEIDDKKMGPLLQKPIFGLLSKLRPNTDVIYETGATGSRFQSVEKKVAKYVNVFTCGFPFFASQVLTREMMKPLGTNLDCIEKFWGDKYYEVDFQGETAAIDTLLGSLHLVPATATDRVSEITCERFRTQLINQCKEWAARKNSPRRWLIVTLHHRGAIGVDLSLRKVWHCSIPGSVPNLPPNVQFNTSGAGDCFRGALMHALLNSETLPQEPLPHVLRFCTKAATAWCHHFRVADSLEYLHTNLAGEFTARPASAP